MSHSGTLARLWEKLVSKAQRWMSEEQYNLQRAFMLGVAASFGTIGCAQLVMRVRKRQVERQRHLSHLHHLDLTATTHNTDNSSPRREHAAVYQVVLTGGPCAGKSSSMEYFARKLRQHGFDVYLVPEVPTLLQNGGCVYPGLDGGDRLIAFETSLIELQLQIEQSFYNIAQSTNRPSVIIYDRGLLDVAAYLPPDKWEAVLNHNQWLRDGFLGVIERYDLILHLVTAADGAESYYTSHHRARRETVEEAIILDGKIRLCWAGHPYHRIVDNSSDFASKLERASKHLLELVLHHKLL